MNHRAQLVAFERVVVGDSDLDVASMRSFAESAPVKARPGAQSDPPPHSMEPARQRIGVVDGACSPGQQEERYLEGILGQMPVG